MLASVDTVDLARLLLDLLIILVVAKLAAEVAERCRIPAVLGEIVAGILIGPSVLGLIELSGDRGVSVGLLAELGVLLLLLGVGMEMDLDELRRVGGPAMSVAVVGVALPFALGVAVGMAFGLETNTAIFFGAALTATSVGITARVFGDLRALASIEARIVLGAAVADDVLGLVVLTVVVKLVADGSVGIGTVGETLGLAVLFLAVTGAVGVLLIPRLFDRLARIASSHATVTIAGFALTLGFALLADMAKLAFIIGAFMAGLALGRTRQHERISGDLNAVGNLLIPVFFVSIGINADLQAMADPGVIGLAAALTAVAIVGKVAAGWAVVRRPVDRFLIGLGMIPRGEVGLIFAAIGLSTNVLDDEQYGALLIVILVTTLITPPLLRLRLHRGTVDDAAPGADTDGLLVRALEAASAAAGRGLTDEELVWFDQRRDVPLLWTPAATPQLLSLLRSGEPRSMRVLEATGVIDRALPEVSAAMHRRRADLTDLDPLGRLRFPAVDRLRAADGEIDDDLAIAAFIADTCEDVATATSLATRLGDDGSALELLDDARLIRRRALDPAAYEDRDLLQLAVHLSTPQRTSSAARLAHGLGDTTPERATGIDAFAERIIAAQSRAGASGSAAINIAEERRAAAQQLAASTDVAERLAFAPVPYLLAHDPDELARQARLVEPLPRPGKVRVAISPLPEPDHWRVEFACRDMSGLLARLADALNEHGLDVVTADLATWPDGGVIDSFVVHSRTRPPAADLARTVEDHLGRRLRALPIVGAALEVDQAALPWHTLCTVSAPDRAGTLRAVAHAFATADVHVHSAALSSHDGRVLDRFWVTDRFQRKIDDATIARVRAALGATS